MTRRRSVWLATVAVGALIGAVGVVGAAAAPPADADASAVTHWNLGGAASDAAVAVTGEVGLPLAAFSRAARLDRDENPQPIGIRAGARGSDPEPRAPLIQHRRGNRSRRPLYARSPNASCSGSAAARWRGRVALARGARSSRDRARDKRPRSHPRLRPPNHVGGEAA